MKYPTDFDAPIAMGIPAPTRSDQFTVMQRTFLAQLGGVVMRVPEHIPDRHRQLLQQLGGDHIVGVTGDGELRRQRNPEAADDDRQMQLPAVPPAVIPGLTPGGFGVNRSMRDFPSQPMFLMPDATVGAQGRTVDGGRMPLGCPRLQQRDQMASQTSNQRGQPRGQGLKASFPSTPRGKTAVLRQQGPNLLGYRIGLFEKVEQGVGRIESPNNHDDERFDKELVGIELLPPTLAFDRGRGRGYLLDEPE